MGYVYKARQTKLDRLVALKILPGHLADEPSFRERFEREARVLAKLQHPLIVGVYDFGDVTVGASPIFFLMLEYVDGVNLREAMRAGRFTPEQALAVVPQVCDALQYAHSKGVLHRDIKPENILLDTEGRVKIADFGIAKVLDPYLDGPDQSNDPGRVSESEMAVTRLTATGSVLGTPLYMAPEQMISPNAVDHRADIYSLGVVFYEMLTGELPMGRFAPPSAKSRSDRQIDLRIDEIVMRALAKERELRQQSAGEMKSEVETVSATRGQVRATDPTREKRATPAEHSAPGPGGDLGKTLLALLIIGFLGVAIPAIAFAVVAPIVFVNAIIFGIATNELGSTAPAFVICAVFDLMLISAIWRIWLKDFSPRRAGAFLRRLIHPDDPPSRRRPVEDPQQQQTEHRISGGGGWLALGALLVGMVLCVLPMVAVRTETRRDAETVDFNNSTITQNTRGAYPIEHVTNVTVQPAVPSVVAVCLAVGLTVAGAVIPIVLGWRHLLRLRHHQRREGIIPALIAAWFLPLILLDILTVYLIFQPLEPLRHQVASHDYAAWMVLMRYLAGLVCLMVDGVIVAATWHWVTQTPFSRGDGRSGTGPVASSILRRVSGAVLILVACLYLCHWYSYVGIENQSRMKRLDKTRQQIEHQLRTCQTEVESLSLQLAAPQSEMVAKKLADSVRSRFAERQELERARVDLEAEFARDRFNPFLPYALFAVPLIAAGGALLASSSRVAWCVGSAVTSLVLVFLMSRSLAERHQFRDPGISFTSHAASAIDKPQRTDNRTGGSSTLVVPDQTQFKKHEVAANDPADPVRYSLRTRNLPIQGEATSLVTIESESTLEDLPADALMPLNEVKP